MDTIFEIFLMNEAYKEIKSKLSPQMRDYIHDVAPRGKVGKYGEWVANQYGNVGDDETISISNTPNVDDLKKWLDIFDRDIQGDIKDYTRHSFKTKVEDYIEHKNIKHELKVNPESHIETIVDNSEYRINLVKSYYGAKWYDRHIDPDVDSACTWCVGKSESYWKSQSNYGKLYFYPLLG